MAAAVAVACHGVLMHADVRAVPWHCYLTRAGVMGWMP